jgi:chromosomal replication initiator protein
VFRRKMRDLDLLVIDDVHFLGGKKVTQEEFLHTFNAIEAMGRQVVLASDEHPKMIDEFGESLINRFVSGMVVRIDPPNYATRCEILRSLSLRSGVVLSEEVIGWVARRVTQNVRELEGALNRIAAYAAMQNRPIDLDFVTEVLANTLRANQRRISIDEIQTRVSEHYRIRKAEMTSARRAREVARPRQVAMYLSKQLTPRSLPEIGRRFGGRRHFQAGPWMSKPAALSPSSTPPGSASERRLSTATVTRGSASSSFISSMSSALESSTSVAGQQAS